MPTTETKIKKPKAVPNKAGKAVKASATASGGVPKKAGKVSVKKEKPAAGESNVVLRIRVRAYESKILDASVKQIMDTATRYDAVIIGPVPLPTEIKKYTVNRSAF